MHSSSNNSPAEYAVAHPSQSQQGDIADASKTPDQAGWPILCSLTRKGWVIRATREPAFTKTSLSTNYRRAPTPKARTINAY
jgi:hypothetical protein